MVRVLWLFLLPQVQDFERIVLQNLASSSARVL